MPPRFAVYATAAVWFTLALVGVVSAQDAPAGERVVRPSQTVIQFDTASLITAAGVGCAALGTGIRSAAKVITNYMTARDQKDAQRDAALAEVVKTLAGLVEKYHADRSGATQAVESLGEDLEDLKDAVAELSGKPKARRRRSQKHENDGSTDDTATRSNL